VSLQRTDEADVAFGLEVEIEIEEEFDVLAGAIAEACKLIVERLLDADRRVELGSAGRATEAGHVEFRTPTVEQKKVGLKRREALLAHSPSLRMSSRVRIGGRPIFSAWCRR
jgi:hypothetical protein